MELIEKVLTVIIGGPIVVFILYTLKLESRLKDLEHKIESLDQFKNIIERVGLDRVEKVFREEEEGK